MHIQRLQIAMLLILVGVFSACGKHTDELPPARSSVTFGMDGSHHLPPAGQPTSSTTLPLPAPDLPTTAPLALITNDSETYAIAQGRIIVIGSPKSSRILARSTDSSIISELLCDSSAIFAVHLNGSIERYGLDGKIAWHTSGHAMPHLGSMVAGQSIVVMNDSQVIAYSTKDGAQFWSYRGALIPTSLCFDKGGVIYAALTGNDPAGTDSIVCFDLGGKITARAGFAKTRITSNLSLCEGKGIAFGSLTVSEDKSDTRVAHISMWSDVMKSPKKVWDHQLPYIVSSVANDGAVVLSSGFRETAGELISGIDAFSASDSSKLWQRRFSYAAVSPICLSRGFAYMPFTFTTNATVPTKSILVTLDLSDGKTAGEFGVPNASTGFVQGVAAPIGGMLAYADRSVPRIYFLKP